MAQNVTLDTSFGVGGITVIPISQTNENILGLEYQSDGKIVCLTSFTNQNNSNIVLTRYSSEGILDSSFGIAGYVSTDINYDFPINSIKIQNDDKILVSGRNTDNNNQISVFRYDKDGIIDTSFGNFGVSNSFDNFYECSIDIQNDLKIVLAGSCFNNGSDFGISRLNSDGSIDQSFGNLGKINYNIGGNLLNTDDRVCSVKVLLDDKIVISGYSFATSNTIDFAMVKLNTDGTLDTSFGNEGIVVDDYGGSEYFVCLNSDSNNNLYVGGISGFNSSSGVAIGKYNANGVLDATFGNQGKVITNSTEGTNFSISDFSISDDGKITCVGYDYNQSTQLSDMLLLKYSNSGILDVSFDSDGVYIKDFNNLSDGLSTLKLKTDGKILCGGSINFGTSSNSDSALVQFNVTNLSTSLFSKPQFSVSPNPFTTSINLTFSLSKNEILTIDLVDANGRLIQNLSNEKSFSSGNNSLYLDLPETLSKGIYFLKINDGFENNTIKIIK